MTRDVEPQLYLPIPKAHHARCAPTLENAGPALNRPSDFGIGSPRHLRSWRFARFIAQRSVQVSLELFGRRRARRRRLLPRSPSGRRGFARIQLKQIAVGDRGSLKGLTHFPRSASVVRIELAESKRDARKRTSGADVVVAPLWAFSTSARVPTARIFPSLTATAARPGVAADDDPRGGQNRSPSPGPHG